MFLGIDIGTSAAKGLVLRRDGVIAAVASAEYPVSTPRPGWSEQDPTLWWDAAQSVVRSLLEAAGVDRREIGAIGVSGQMHGSVFLDSEAMRVAGNARIHAIRPALLWNDQRTASQCLHIEKALGGRDATIRAVGNAPLTGFTLPKLLWLREHEPTAFARTKQLLNPKDFITLNMTGVASTDVGDASGTLLFDPSSRRWSESATRAFDLDPSLLPPAHESAGVIGELTTWAADRLGLARGTPVVAGSGDNQCGAVGAGIVEAGMVGATLGTSGVIYAHAEAPLLDLATGGGASPTPSGRVHTMCAASGAGAWCNTGCMLSAAGALHWARDTLAPGTAFGDLIAEAASVDVGSEGLLFLPHLSGERCPHPDSNARAAWIGLTARHTRAHMVRAVLEGVAFTMSAILDIVRALPVPVQEIRLGGGGSKSRLWAQMHADVFGLPVALANTEEGPALGAALLAGVGVGAWPSVPAACADVIKVREVISPSPATDRYRPFEEVHRRLYRQLRETFWTIARTEHNQ